MAQQGPSYTGIEILESLEGAVRYNRYLLETIRRYRPVGGRWLDFGAGIGTFCLALRAEGHDILCLEPDEKLAERLRSADFEVSAATDVIPTSSIDYIYSLNVLEHIEDDEATLRELYRILAPEGCLMLYVPAFPILFGALDRLVGHHRRYLLKPFSSSVQRAGFEIREARYVDSLGFFATLLFKTLRIGNGIPTAGQIGFYDRWLFSLSSHLDLLTNTLFGKNILVIAQKRG